MATATYTATTFNNPPRQLHAGVNHVSGSYNAGAVVTSLGDVIFLAKIPHGATILDILVDHSSGETATGVDYGLAKGHDNTGNASLSCFASAVALATITRNTVRRAAGLGPQRVSVSDLDPVRYGIFSAVPRTGSASLSLMINFSITYRMDDVT
jgi:hypothetical protein